MGAWVGGFGAMNVLFLSGFSAYCLCVEHKRNNDQYDNHECKTNAQIKMPTIAIETLQITGDAERKGAATAAGIASGGRAISAYYYGGCHMP